jgi:hypothetical protein
MAKAPIDIRSLARTHSKAAITTLASIMYEPKCKASDRINAAEALLNRGYGKATQPVGLADDARMQISEIKLVIIDTAQRERVIGHDEPKPEPVLIEAKSSTTDA